MTTVLLVFLGAQGVLNAGAALTARNGVVASLNLLFAGANAWAAVLIWRLP